MSADEGSGTTVDEIRPEVVGAPATGRARRAGARVAAVLAAVVTAAGSAVAVAAPAAAAEPVVETATLTTGGTPLPVRAVPGSPETPAGGIRSVLAVNGSGPGCVLTDFGSYGGFGITDMLVLPAGGGCTDDVKVRNAAERGADGVVIVHDSPANSLPGAVPVPAVTITSADAAGLLQTGSGDAVLTVRYRTVAAPTAAADAYRTPQGTSLTVPAPGVLTNDTDPDPDTTLTATDLVTTGTRGSVLLNPEGGFTYQPATGFSGADTFTYRASDGMLASGPTTVTVTVDPPPVAPAVSAVSGGGQSAQTGAAFANPLVARVAAGTIVTPGVPVTFTVSSGSASFPGGASATVTTGPDGRATAPTLTAGSTAGPVTVTATGQGATGSASFSATVTAAPAIPNRADLVATLTAPDSAAKGQTVTVTLVVRNNGPAPAVAVVSGVTLPDGMSAVDAGGGAATNNRRAIGFGERTIAANTATTYRITATVSTASRASASIYGGVLSVRTQDPNYADNGQRRTVALNPR